MDADRGGSGRSDKRVVKQSHVYDFYIMGKSSQLGLPDVMARVVCSTIILYLSFFLVTGMLQILIHI
jgi:hypothetical protein